jgi:pimeloyl-ACP methyl ester carboxylesterase
MKETPTLLLVHGAWHGPWCWEQLIPELDRLGLTSATVALPSVGTDAGMLGGVADDAAAIEAAVESIGRHVVVVAHSYGGVPTTQAMFGPKVKHIIYLGAFMPDAGQSLVDLLPPGPLPPFVVGHENGTTTVHRDHAVATFYADVDPATAGWAMSRLRPHNGVTNVTPVTRTSWREQSSTYILLTEDYACPTPVQRVVCRQATDWRELPGSHSPFLAQPKVLAEMLGGIVAAHVHSEYETAS